jgi:CubicO group peptidase (beta-lactamase class C family)
VTTPPLPTVDPVDAGLDPGALETLRAKVHQQVDEGRMPACQFAFAVDGELAVFESFGEAAPTTRFNVFSATKAFIGGVVWQLIGEGRLTPATRAIELIPGFGVNGRTPDRMAEVTLEHLLTHTSGFPMAPLGPPRWDSRESRLEVFSRWYATADPGTSFTYHPTAAHWVVAEMIETLEGRDYRQVVAERILEPLGLRSFTLGEGSTADDVAELRIVGEPATYEELAAVMGEFDRSLLDEVTPAVLLAFNDPAIRAVGVPGGGGVSTAADLALYYQELLHNRAGLWDPEVLADATGTIRCALPNPMTGVASNRTLGLIVAGDDGLGAFRGMGATVSARAFGHNGAAGQIVWGDPASGVSFALTTSGIDPHPLREAQRIASLGAKAGACAPWSR